MKSVSGALTVLGVALTFVYVVFFGVHGTDFAQDPVYQQIAAATGTASLPVGDTQGLDELLAVAIQEQESSTAANTQQGAGSSGDEISETVSAPERTRADGVSQVDRAENVTFYSVQQLFAEQNVQNPQTLALSGTHRREGTMKSLQMLGLQDDAEYILKDNLNTHYVYLGDDLPEIEERVLSLSGNVVEIGDENAIKQHVLFGDQVWFINLPAYEQVKVLMLVRFEGQDDVWFLQIDQDSYYQLKPQLQTTFGMFYDRGE